MSAGAGKLLWGLPCLTVCWGGLVWIGVGRREAVVVGVCAEAEWEGAVVVERSEGTACSSIGARKESAQLARRPANETSAENALPKKQILLLT